MDGNNLIKPIKIRIGQNTIQIIRKIVVFLLVCLTAYQLGKGNIFILNYGFGAGNIVRSIFPAVLCLAAILFIVRPDLLPRGGHSARIGFREVLLILFIAPLLAYPLGTYISNLTHLILFIIILSGVLTAIYLALTRNDLWGIVVFLFTEPLMAYFQWDLMRYSFYGFISLSYISFLLVIGAYVVSILKSGFEHPIKTSLDKYILVFIMILFLASILSPNPAQSFRVFFMVAILLPLYFLVNNLIRTKKDIIILLVTLVFVSLLKCFVTGYALLKGFGFSITSLIDMRGGLISNPTAPLSLGGPIPIAVSLAIIYSNRSKRWIYFVLAIMVFIFFMLVSQTRSSMFLFAIGTPMILFYRQGKRWILIGLITIFLATLISGSASIFFHRYAELAFIDGWLSSLRMRLDGWRSAIEMIRDYPFFGIGLGMWEEFIHIYGTPFKMIIEGEVKSIYITSAHYGYLQYGAEAGVGALLVLFLIILKAQLRTFYVLKSVKDYDIYTIAVGMAWIMLGTLFMGVYFVSRGYIVGMGFWCNMAIIMALERVAHVPSTLTGDTKRI